MVCKHSRWAPKKKQSFLDCLAILLFAPSECLRPLWWTAFTWLYLLLPGFTWLLPLPPLSMLWVDKEPQRRCDDKRRYDRHFSLSSVALECRTDHILEDSNIGKMFPLLLFTSNLNQSFGRHLCVFLSQTIDHFGDKHFHPPLLRAKTTGKASYANGLEGAVSAIITLFASSRQFQA